VEQMSVLIAGNFLLSAHSPGSVPLELYVTLSFVANLEIFSPSYISSQFTHLGASLKDSLCWMYVYGKVWLSTTEFQL